MRSEIANIRRVSLEVIIFCVLLSPMKQIEKFWVVVVFLSGDLLQFVLKSPEINPTIPQKGSICFMGDNNKQNMMTSNETRLTVAIADLIISEGLSFNIYQKPRF